MNSQWKRNKQSYGSTHTYSFFSCSTQLKLNNMDWYLNTHTHTLATHLPGSLLALLAAGTGRMHYQVMPKQMHLNGRQTLTRTGSHNGHLTGSAGPRSSICMAGPLPPILLDWIRFTLGQIPGRNSLHGWPINTCMHSSPGRATISSITTRFWFAHNAMQQAHSPHMD